MNCNEIKEGMHVKVVNFLEVDPGMLVHPRHLGIRKIGATGIVRGYVPGHGGDVWWVQHDNNENEIGAYPCSGLEECPPKRPQRKVSWK